MPSNSEWLFPLCAILSVICFLSFVTSKLRCYLYMGVGCLGVVGTAPFIEAASVGAVAFALMLVFVFIFTYGLARTFGPDKDACDEIRERVGRLRFAIGLLIPPQESEEPRSDTSPKGLVGIFFFMVAIAVAGFFLHKQIGRGGGAAVFYGILAIAVGILIFQGSFHRED